MRSTDSASDTGADSEPTNDEHPHRLSLAALLGAALAVLGLVLFGRIPSEGRWASDLGNASHGPAFAVVVLIVITLRRRVRRGHMTVLGEYFFAISVGVLLGAFVEVLQSVTGRDASFDDLLRDTLGALAGTGFFATVDPRVHMLPRCKTIQRIGILIGVIGTTFIVAPLAITGAAYLQRNRSFPTLVDFGSPLSTYFLGVYSAVTVKREALPPNMSEVEPGNVGLHASLGGNEGWALALWEPQPDWRGYGRVRFDVANPSEDLLRIDIRIRDKHPHHDRRNGDIGTIEIAPRARQTVTIELPHKPTDAGERAIDLAAVQGFVLKRSSTNQAHEFYLVRIWLE